VLGQVGKQYEILKIGDTYDEVKADYHNVRDNAVIWVNGKTVTPFFHTPKIGHGQYDADKKTFLCIKQAYGSVPSNYTLPHPCWSPLTRELNSRFSLLGVTNDQEIAIDTNKMIAVVEQSGLFNSSWTELIANTQKENFAYLKVRDEDGHAEILTIDNIPIEESDIYIKVTPGRHKVSMQAVRYPEAHGDGKMKKEETRNFVLKAGYYNYIAMKCGIAMVGLVCPPKLFLVHCRDSEGACKPDARQF